MILAAGLSAQRCGAGNATGLRSPAGCVNTKALGVTTGEVGAGKTFAPWAVIADLDPSHRTVIHLPTPGVGMRGLHEAVVSGLGGTPRYRLSTLTSQCVDSPNAENAERGRARSW